MNCCTRRRRDHRGFRDRELFLSKGWKSPSHSQLSDRFTGIKIARENTADARYSPNSVSAIPRALSPSFFFEEQHAHHQISSRISHLRGKARCWCESILLTAAISVHQLRPNFQLPILITEPTFTRDERGPAGVFPNGHGLHRLPRSNDNTRTTSSTQKPRSGWLRRSHRPTKIAPRPP